MGEETLENDLLDVLYATFGRHAGYRVTHARGFVARGTFTAAPGAREVSRATHFQGQRVPVLLRFSNFSGIPVTPDADPMASPRGLGIRFHLSETAFTDLVAHSNDGFPVATAQEFLQFLRGIAASGAASPDPAPLAAYLADHPHARRYLETTPTTPASYLAERYYGVNTFAFINREGELTHGRYRVDPTIDEPLLEDREASQRPHDFLAQDMASRLRQGPVAMRLMLQLAAAGDVLADGSISWPHSGLHARREIELGLIGVDSGDVAQDEQGIAFNPGHLTDGIAPGDPMITLRQRVYELAAARRRT